MKYKVILTLMFLLSCSLSLIAQQIVQDDLGEHNPNLQAKRGTYEVILDPSKGVHIVEMTAEVLKRIEKNREEHTYAYIQIAPSITVKIYPRTPNSINTINTKKDEK